jgi:hypothetical protein
VTLVPLGGIWIAMRELQSMLESASPNVLQTIEANQFEYRSGCGALTSLPADREATK